MSYGDACNKILKFADKQCDYVQVNLSQTNQKSVDSKKEELHCLDNTVTASVSVDVWIKGKKGSSSSNIVDLEVAKQAIKIAKTNKKEEYFYGIPEKSKYPKLNVYDKKVAGLKDVDILDVSKQIIEEIKSNKTIASQAGVNCSVDRELLLNSNGIVAKEKTTNYSMYAVAITKKGKVSTYWDSKENPFYFELGSFAKNIKQKTIEFANAKKIKQKPGVVVFNIKPLAEILKFALLSNFNGKIVEKGRSVFTGSLNKKIFSDDISVIDNGIMEKGINSYRFDDEGSPAQKTVLVDKGVLKNFLYDFNTGKHNNARSTGNAAGKGIVCSNIVIKGKQNKIKNALIVEAIIGAHTSNPVTTAFSVKIEQGYLLQNGKKVPVKDAMLFGKVTEMLKQVVSIEKKKQEHSGIYSGSLACKGVKII